VLIKRKDGEGRLPACEILFSSPALSRIILDGRIHEIPLLLQTGKAKGMISMDEAIESLLKKELIDPQDAYALIKSRKEFKSGF
jgi:twitching motility protein PilT